MAGTIPQDLVDLIQAAEDETAKASQLDDAHATLVTAASAANDAEKNGLQASLDQHKVALDAANKALDRFKIEFKMS